VQAFCRGAGLDPATLSPEAQAMLPLVAGQLLRETVVGINDILRARNSGAVGAAVSAMPVAPGNSSNPLRSSTSIEQALQRLFESHGRLFAGPVDSLRDVLQETRDHETALAAGMKAGLAAVLGQLAPASVADQFEQGRARQLAPGQDPRPRYWEHYSEFYRLLTQQAAGIDEMPRSFTEAFGLEYARVRAELRQKRPA
jgi:type VI secretion system FHA domain protein